MINKEVDRRTRRNIRWTVLLLALVVLGIYLVVFLDRL
jgi:predicted nucleic acid-binding Zn ribbon protein